MKYLFFDTETTGRAKAADWKFYHDLTNFPECIELGWALYDEEAKLLKERCDLIKPDGWKIPDGDFWKNHGFSQEKNESNGIPIAEAIGYFIAEINEAEEVTLVAHNMNFDFGVIGTEMVKLGLKNAGMTVDMVTQKGALHLMLKANKKTSKVCTMEVGMDYLKIPKTTTQQRIGGGEYKFPRLDELYKALFNDTFEGAHNALADVHACARCFFELKELLVIP